MDDVIAGAPRWQHCHYCDVRVVLAGDPLPPGTVSEPGIAFAVGPEPCPCGRHREGDICALDGIDILPPGFVWGTYDHKIPRCRGGSNRPVNLVPCCHSCNSRKRDKPYYEFLFGERIPDDVRIALQPSRGLGFLDKWVRERERAGL